MKKIVSLLIIGLTIFSISCSKNTDPIGPGSDGDTGGGGSIIQKEISDDSLNIGNILSGDQANVEYRGALVIYKGEASSEKVYGDGKTYSTAKPEFLPLVYVEELGGTSTSVTPQSIIKGMEAKLQERLEDFSSINAGASKITLETSMGSIVPTDKDVNIIIEISSKGNTVFEDGTTTKKIRAQIRMQRGTRAPTLGSLPTETKIVFSEPFGTFTIMNRFNNANLIMELPRGTIGKADEVLEDLELAMNDIIQSAGYTLSDATVALSTTRMARSSDTINNITSYKYTVSGIKGLDDKSYDDVELTLNIQQLDYKLIKKADVDLTITTPSLKDVVFTGLNIVDSVVATPTATVYADDVATYKKVADKVVAAYNAAQASIGNNVIDGVTGITASYAASSDYDASVDGEKTIPINVTLSVDETDKPDYLFLLDDGKRKTEKTVTVNLSIKKETANTDIADTDIDFTIAGSKFSDAATAAGIEIEDAAAPTGAKVTVPPDANSTYRDVILELTAAIAKETVPNLTMSSKIVPPSGINQDTVVGSKAGLSFDVVITLKADAGFKFVAPTGTDTRIKVIEFDVAIVKGVSTIDDNTINADITGALNSAAGGNVVYASLEIASAIPDVNATATVNADATVSYQTIANDIIETIRTHAIPNNDLRATATAIRIPTGDVAGAGGDIKIKLTFESKGGYEFTNGDPGDKTTKTIDFTVKAKKGLRIIEDNDIDAGITVITANVTYADLDIVNGANQNGTAIVDAGVTVTYQMIADAIALGATTPPANTTWTVAKTTVPGGDVSTGGDNIVITLTLTPTSDYEFANGGVTPKDITLTVNAKQAMTLIDNDALDMTIADQTDFTPTGVIYTGNLSVANGGAGTLTATYTHVGGTVPTYAAIYNAVTAEIATAITGLTAVPGVTSWTQGTPVYSNGDGDVSVSGTIKIDLTLAAEAGSEFTPGSGITPKVIELIVNVVRNN